MRMQLIQLFLSRTYDFDSSNNSGVTSFFFHLHLELLISILKAIYNNIVIRNII